MITAPEATRTRKRTVSTIHRVNAAARRSLWSVRIAMLLTLVAAVALRTLAGDFTITLPDALRIINGAEIPPATFILMESKLPRAVLGLIAGGALGAAGAAMQAMLRNPLASPDVLGVTIGASAGAVAAITLGNASGSTVTVVALAGALGVAAMLAFVGGRGSAGLGQNGVILAGVGLSAILAAAIHALLLKSNVHVAQEAFRWLSGSLSQALWSDIWRAAVGVGLLLPLLLLMGRTLVTLSLGSDLAQGLGVTAGRAHRLMLFVVVLLVAITVAACGPILFVALLSGPISRMVLKGRLDLPTAALVGASLTVGADYLAAYGLPDTNLPVGLVTGVIGAPVLLWLTIRSNRTTGNL